MNLNTQHPKNGTPNPSPDQQLVIILNKQLIKKIVKVLLVILSVGAMIRLLPIFMPILLPLLVSLVISLLLTPLVDKLENLGINRGAAVGILFIVFGGLIIVGIKLLLPTLNHEIQTLSQVLASQDSETVIDKIQMTLTHRIPILKNPEIAREVSARLHDLFTSLVRKSLNMIFAIISSFTLIVTVPFITFFFLKDGYNIKKFIIQSVPNRYFELSLNLLYKTNLQLGNYIRGQLLVSSIVGSLSIIALYSLKVPYCFVIGIIAGLANMIPYFGPIVGALPAILVAVVENGTAGSVIGIIIAFAMIQLLDNVLISPVIVSRSVQIHPLLVIIVILLGGNIGGIFGMLVAIPAFAVAQVIVKEIVWSFKHYRLSI
ncbi:MAG: AI-2E family transporter [candidate division KSB1 bacterium]|nr:AI-2E family transporter [candidate division KSB1 bacterium]MDZ7334241.1 AI-2E family transporter [candidate division KSB1 bacterium]MDZ7356361.1 AI-2E family transporter [candidate division KSB1 bacterium]MDZ7376084.1 AI-2E family transporter [candidate division KSB1 bacterium]MDZ7401053.1 AI-2E family transporter [candidate division KSB1 bacterium]